MPGLNTARLQGQADANASMRDAVGTLSNIWLQAKAANEAKDYFDPSNEAARQFAKEEKSNIIKNMRQFSKFKERVAQNPEAITEFYKEKYGTRWDLTKDSSGNYILQEYGPDGRPTNRNAKYSSLDHMMSDAAMQFFSTTPEMLSSYMGRYGKQVETASDIYKYNMTDMQKAILDAQVRQNIANTYAGADRFGSLMNYRGIMGSADLRNRMNEKEMISTLQNQSLLRAGLVADKDGSIKSADGTPLTPEQLNYRLNLANEDFMTAVKGAQNSWQMGGPYGIGAFNVYGNIPTPGQYSWDTMSAPSVDFRAPSLGKYGLEDYMNSERPTVLVPTKTGGAIKMPDMSTVNDILYNMNMNY